MEEETEETSEIEESKAEEDEVTEVTERAEETEEPTESEEEEKEAPKAEKKREKEKEDIAEEKVYTIPLAKAWIAPKNKRATRAIRLIRAFIVKHMKLKLEMGEDEEEAERLVISEGVNRRIWNRGIEKPPRRIRVRAVKDKEGTVTLYLAEGD